MDVRHLSPILVALLAAACMGTERVENAFWVDADDVLPKVVLAKGDARIVVLLPDEATMASDRWSEDYGGIRFDWAGRVALAEYRGHTFIGGWTEVDGRRVPKYSLGTSEECKLTIPIEPDPGDVRKILKPGVGIGRRAETKGPWRVEPIPWTVERGTDHVDFRQSAAHPSGHGWDYTKRVTITGNGFAIAHRFENRGRERMTFRHYSHNWIQIDSAPVGRAYRARFAFPLAGRINGRGGAQFVGRELNFLGTGEPLPSLMAKLEGFSTPAHNRVTITHTGTWAAICIEGDWTPAAYHVYARLEELCPEPFLALDLAPGEARAWTTRYTFLLAGAAEKTQARP